MQKIGSHKMNEKWLFLVQHYPEVLKLRSDDDVLRCVMRDVFWLRFLGPKTFLYQSALAEFIKQKTPI